MTSKPDSLDYPGVARRFLHFRPRRDADCIELPDDPRSLAADGVVQQFERSMASEFQGTRRDDIENLVLSFLSRRTDLAQWYEALLEEANIEIRFVNGEPLVFTRDLSDDQLCVQRWMDLSAWIDPDSMISYAFARTFRRMPNSHDLANWGVYARVHEVDVLGQPMWRRLRDIHTHLSGCECVPVIWNEILNRETNLLAMPAYGTYQRIRDHPGTLSDEARLISAAMEEWRVATRWLSSQAPPTLNRGLAQVLWPERSSLIAAWLIVLDHSSLPGRQDDTPARSATTRHFTTMFARYLFAKNQFVRRHIQSPGSNPGLESFRRNFDLLRPIRQTRSSSVVRRYLTRWRDFAFDAPSIDHIEFRIAPCLSVAEYTRHLGNLREVFRDVSNQSPRPGISGRSLPRFVVHFIRDRIEPVDLQDGFDPRRLWTRLDREFAALRWFLYDPGAPDSTLDVRDLIVGIDVCNIERNAPIEYFAPYINFLRSQGFSEEQERFLDLECPYFSRTRAWSMVPVQSGQNADLGLTVHCGEDYYHPLIGLREIWIALNVCNMNSRDRIGHGLVLGADIPEFARLFGSGCVVPQGQILDAIVWMHRRFGAIAEYDEITSRLLEDAAEHLSREIFSATYRIEDLYAASTLRQFPVDQSTFNSIGFHELTRLADGTAPMNIYWSELFDRNVQRRRARLVKTPSELNTSRVIAAMGQVQEWLVDQVCSRGVTIEMNPSSNRALSDFTDMWDHPVLKAKIKSPGLKVAISTDDPGNFGTRIENEYALALLGLRGLGLAGAEQTRLVREIIEQTRTAAFGRVAYSNDLSQWHTAGVPVRHNPDSPPD